MVFDGQNKIITLTSSTVTAVEIWSRWNDWLASDTENTKWPQAMIQVGGDDLGGGLLIPPYIFLTNGWRIRPMESNHLLIISGNVYVEGGGQPVVNTLGAYNVSVQYTVPVQAQGYSTTSSGDSLTASEVWNYTQRELTSASSSSLTTEQNAKLMSLDTAGVPSAVWANSSRTLTQSVAAEVDLSTIPAAVWSYVSRELTVAAGLTPAQEAKIDSVLTKLGTTLDANIKSVQGTSVISVEDFKADVSALDGLNVNIDPADIWNYSNRTLSVPAGLTSEQEAKIDSIKTKTDKLTFDITNHLLSYIEDKTGYSLSSSDKNTISQSIWEYSTRALTQAVQLDSGIISKIDAIKAKTDKMIFDFSNHLYSYVEDRTGYTLLPQERIDIANEVENQIINETDSEKVLQAITDKIASVNPSLGSLTTEAIASSVWSYISRTTHDVQGMTFDQETKLNSIKSKTDKLTFDLTNHLLSYIEDKNNFNLSEQAKIDIANEVERQIIDETDSEKVLKAITDKIAQINPDLSSLTTSNIASAVWSYTLKELSAPSGMTYTQETKLDSVLSKVSGVLQADVRKVNNVSVNNISEFRSTLSASDIWAYGTRTLSAPSGLTVGQEAILEAINTKVNSTMDANIKSVQGINVSSVNDFKSSLTAANIWSYSTRDLTYYSGLSPAQEAKIDAIKAKTDKMVFDLTNHLYSYVEDRTGFSLTSADKIAIANEVENQIINETDSEKVLTAITDKIASVNPSLGDLTVSSIASAVWDYSVRTTHNVQGLTFDQETKLNSIKSKTDKLTFDLTNHLLSYIEDKNNFNLSLTERNEIAKEIEKHILDESDGKTILAGITDKISSVFPNLSDISNAQVASAVWSFGTRALTDKTVDITKVNGSPVSIGDFRNDLSGLNSAITNLPTNVWSFNNRNLTQTFSIPSAADIWSYSSRALTDKTVDITKVNGIEVDINDFKASVPSSAEISTAVWSSISRTLTGEVQIPVAITSKINTLHNYDDSTLMTEIGYLADKQDITNINNKLDSKPSLGQIETSSVLAKASQLDVIQGIVDSIPQLSELRDEMINVQFGGLEIANNQMTIKDKSGVIIAIFNLKDNLGNATMQAVYKREVVQ